MEGLEVSWF